MHTENGNTELGLDKWLWAARFFKTRQLAVAAITGGKVHVNGPGGDTPDYPQGSLEWDLVVEGISRQRRPTSEAALLHMELSMSLPAVIAISNVPFPSPRGRYL